MILLAALFLVLADVPIGLTPEAVVWKDAPPSMPAGTKMAVLEGDPRSGGFFTVRVRVPAGASLAPHWHPRDERVTILSGAAEVGFGSTANPSMTRRYGPGSFYVNPPRTMHYVSFPEETVMQMTGIGPWEIMSTDIGATAGQNATGRVSVRSVTPPAGTPLTSDAKIEATVDYAIDGFRPDTFHLSVQFATTTPDRTVGARQRVVAHGSAPPPAPVIEMLREAKGTAVVTAPVAEALITGDVQKPVRVKVYLHEATSERTSRVIATTDWIEYR